MKKILMSAAAVAMFFATGCSNEELVQSQQTESREFSLTVNKSTESRTVMEEDVNKWDKNDAVYVFSADGSVYGVLRIDWSTVSSDGKTATFTGTVNGAATLTHVVFPAPEGSSIPTPGGLKIHINHVDGAEHNAPMYGEIDGNSSTFEHVGGLVKFDVNGVGKGQEIEMTAKVGDKSIAGGFYKFEDGGLKYYENPNDKTTIHNVPADGVFYLPIASDKEADTEENAEKAVITGELVDRSQQNEKRVQIISESNVAVSKGKISDDAEKEITLPENVLTPIVVTDATTLKEAINSADVVNVVLNAEATITLAEKLTINEDKVVTIDLNGGTLDFDLNDHGIENWGTLNMNNGDIDYNCTLTVIYGSGKSAVMNRGKVAFEEVDVTSNNYCLWSMDIADADFKKTLDEYRAAGQSVVADLTGGIFTSTINLAHQDNKAHTYAVVAYNNSKVKMNGCEVIGEGGIEAACADLELINTVMSTANCGKGDAYGVYALASGIISYDKTCILGTVYAQVYNSGRTDFYDEYGKMIVNGYVITENDVPAGALAVTYKTGTPEVE